MVSANSNQRLEAQIASAKPEHERRFAQLSRTLRTEPNVTLGEGGSKRFGHAALKVNGKIFAMVSSAGALVVKLPKHRVAELEASGVGMPFIASAGRPMKEWLSVRPEAATPWLALAREALAFVGGLP